jgi:hypothetical protein
MTALHPAQLWAARQRMVAIATALTDEDLDLIGVALDDMVWLDHVADDDGETWPEFLQRMALPRRD